VSRVIIIVYEQATERKWKKDLRQELKNLNRILEHSKRELERHNPESSDSDIYNYYCIKERIRQVLEAQNGEHDIVIIKEVL